MKATSEGSTERRGLGIVRTAFEEVGFAFREQSVDFGIDAIVEQTEGGEATGRLIAVQIKSGNSFVNKRTSDGSISFPFNDDHAEYWLANVLPVVVCLCDVEKREVFWQSVNSDTMVSTGKGWKLSISPTRKVNADNRIALVDVATPIVAKERYTAIGPEDVSHALAKRYSYRVIVNGTSSRADLASIARQVVAQSAEHTYHSTKIAAQRWSDTKAHIVSVYVAISAAEHARNNYVCRAQWISADLPDGAEPGPWGGSDIGNGVFLIWNENHDKISDLYTDSACSKEEYLGAVVPIFAEFHQLLDQLASGVSLVKAGLLKESDFIVQNRANLDLLWERMITFPENGVAPFECSDLDLQVNHFLNHGSNLKLYFTEAHFLETEQRSRLFLAKMSLDSATETLAKAQYELDKVR